MGIKLSAWAKQNGIDYKTAYRWFRAGSLPVSAWQNPQTGTIILNDVLAGTCTGGVALYARVSSADQKADLDRQISRLAQHAAAERMRVIETVAETGSGLNGHRSKLIRLLKNKEVNTILVEHRDRLARFGTEYVEAALSASGRKVVVLDNTEMKDDLVQDMIDVLTSFCARLYGRRSAKNRAIRAVEAAKQ